MAEVNLLETIAAGNVLCGGSSSGPMFELVEGTQARRRTRRKSWNVNDTGSKMVGAVDLRKREAWIPMMDWDALAQAIRTHEMLHTAHSPRMRPGVGLEEWANEQLINLALYQGLEDVRIEHRGKLDDPTGLTRRIIENPDACVYPTAEAVSTVAARVGQEYERYLARAETYRLDATSKSGETLQAYADAADAQVLGAAMLRASALGIACACWRCADRPAAEAIAGAVDLELELVEMIVSAIERDTRHANVVELAKMFSDPHQLEAQNEAFREQMEGAGGEGEKSTAPSGSSGSSAYGSSGGHAAASEGDGEGLGGEGAGDEGEAGEADANGEMGYSVKVKQGDREMSGSHSKPVIPPVSSLTPEQRDKRESWQRQFGGQWSEWLTEQRRRQVHRTMEVRAQRTTHAKKELAAGSTYKEVPLAEVTQHYRQREEPITDDQPLWGELDVIECTLDDVQEKDRKRTRKRKAKPSERGRMRAVHRLNIDGRVFRERRLDRKKDRTGSIVIDASGSMSIRTEDIRKILDTLPAARVGIYRGTSYQRGSLYVVAANGKMIAGDVHDHVNTGGSNVVDGPALDWLAQQPAPRIWISDGQVSGYGESFNDMAATDAERICRTAEVIRVPDCRTLLRTPFNRIQPAYARNTRAD